MDFQTINKTVDILPFVSNLTPSGEYHIGPCPMCGGVDRFNVKSTDAGQLWLCRRCGNGRYQDVAAFLMTLNGWTASQLLVAYGGGKVPARKSGNLAKGKAPAPLAKPPDKAWQASAWAVAQECAAYLQGDTADAAAARRYLVQKRGLHDETIQAASIGYNPAWQEVLPGHWLAPGLTIPAIIAGQLWYLQVRTTEAARAASEKTGRTLDKYRALKGSRLTALYGADRLVSADVVVITEGEWDALLLSQCLPHDWAAVTMGSAGALPDNPAWLSYFAAVKWAFLVMDNDAAGQAAVKKWAALLSWVELLPVPDGHKDITDFWQAGGNLAAWVGVEMPTDEPEPAYDPARLVVFPAGKAKGLAFPDGTWARQDDGSIAARLTYAQLLLMKAWRDMLAGEDVPDSELIPV